MPKDHYVAQTYLRSFGLSGNSDFINVVRKSNLSCQNAIPIKSICYEIDWNSNEYFPDNPRVVENFLKLIEPKWSECVKSVSINNYDSTTKHLMAGYIAYLRACTPTAVRLGSDGLAHFAHHLYKKIEEKEFSNPDTKYRDVIESIRKGGGVKANIKQAFPKAMGISSLINAQQLIAASPWIIFRNETSEQFLTSDNPVCLKYWNPNQCDLYCPLTPQLALIIHPVRNPDPHEEDHFGSLKPEGVSMLNQLMIQSAEDKVIFNQYDGIESFVKEYRDWRVELEKVKFPFESGHLFIHQQKSCKKGTYK